ncbi:TPA: helix-turn-helix transcriptional regulator [Bacillus pseudomycoides]|nr:helix-turn-helix transcriptional regulator [Bacillus pseudomycoides]
MKNTVGQNIKRFRKSYGLTQEQMSDKTGLSRGQIKNWETDRHEPDLESLRLLASFFNTSIDTLLGFENKPNDALLDLLVSDVKKAYAELDGRQQGRFAKQVSLYVKMLQNNKDIL